MSIEDKLRAIVIECLQVPPASASGSLSREQVPEWDSLNHLRIITAVESEFGVRFTMDEIASLGSLAELQRVVSARLGEQG